MSELSAAAPEPAEPTHAPDRPRRWWAALLLGLLQTGLGQVYNGQARKGLAVYALGWVGLALAAAMMLQPIPLVAPMLLLALCLLLWLAAAGESAWTAYRRGAEFRLRPYNRWYVYLAFFLLAYAVSSAALTIMRRFEQSFYIPSGAMEPTLAVGDHIYVDKARYHWTTPGRGDIVVYRSPEDPRLTLIKRVVAVGGDRVEIRGKRLFRNGQETQEPYAVHNDPNTYTQSPALPQNLSARDNFGPYLVPPGRLFVLGDNRDNSYDSRFYGPVPASLVEGGDRIRIYWSRDPTTGAVRWDRIGRFVK